MLKRFVIALSVTASALLLPATAAQAADGTVTAATTGESGAATTTGVRQIRTPSGAVVTVGTSTGGIRLSDPTDSSWGG